VNVRSSCGRFHRLATERDDRDLTPSELQFMERHGGACEECRQFEAQSRMALNMLRQAALDPEVSCGFDRRVTRRAQLVRAKDGLRYWSPALVGAAIACVCVVATLAVLTRPTGEREAEYPMGQVRVDRVPNAEFPDLRLNSAPTIDK